MDLGLAFLGYLFLDGLFLCMAAEHEITFDVSFNVIYIYIYIYIFAPRTKWNGFGSNTPIFLCF